MFHLLKEARFVFTFDVVSELDLCLNAGKFASCNVKNFDFEQTKFKFKFNLQVKLGVFEIYVYVFVFSRRLFR